MRTKRGAWRCGAEKMQPEQGSAVQDLEAAAEGNLIGNMLQALDDAEFRRMYRDQVAEQEED